MIVASISTAAAGGIEPAQDFQRRRASEPDYLRLLLAPSVGISDD
jgi:hypothetical protein